MKPLFLSVVLLVNLVSRGLGLDLTSSFSELQQKASNIIKELSRNPGENVSDDVSFYLWTRANPKHPSILRLDDTLAFSLDNSNFDPSKPIKVLAHGYTDNGRTGWIIDARDKLLEKGDFNLISVEWEKLAGPSPFYFIAVRNTKLVSKTLGDFINFLIKKYALTTDSFHLIGFSLGAQLVGMTGYKLNGQILRVTGLDPAAPLFHNVSDSDRLSKSSARFVDVIHAAGLWIGVDEPVGHLDYYPNGGFAAQPGCSNENLGLTCSHARANKFFVESVTSDVGFTSYKCDSWDKFQEGLCMDNPTSLMGLPASRRDPEGTYYLRTRDQSPFAIRGKARS